MKNKRILSAILALAMVLCSLQIGLGAIAGAVGFDKTLLSYMIDNHDYFREDRYTVESWANYTSVLNNVTAVNSNSATTDAEAMAAAADLAAAEAALTYRSAEYKSKLNIRLPLTVANGATVTLKFKDAIDSTLSDVAVTAAGATASAVTLGSDGFYAVDLTATAATGEAVKATITYTFNEEEYTAVVTILVAADGTHVANKTALGAYYLREMAKNRQARDYSGGFQTYTSVLAAMATVFANPSSTQTKVDRAIENMNLALDSLVSALADYSRIYALLAQINEMDPDNYNTFDAVNKAVALIEYDLPIDQQYYVDLMADNVQDAVNSLTLKTAYYTVVCVTEDGVQLSSNRYAGTRTYVVRVVAPVHPGYAPDVENQAITLDQDETTVTFVYTPVTYYAYFDPNGGSCDVQSKQLSYDHEYGELPVPTRDGYAFLGWFSSPSAGEQVFADTIVTINYIEQLYAHWSDIESYTIVFDTGDGDPCDPITATYGAEITLPDPYLYGFMSTGWFFDRNCTQPADFTTMPDLGDNGAVITLYPNWVIKQYHVDLDPGEGGVVDDSNYIVTFGSTYGIIPEPTREGHNFIGWYTEPGDAGTLVTENTTVELDVAHTLYAHYTVNSYTLYFDMDGGEAIDPITQDYGTPVVLPTQPAKEYDLFSGWTLDGEPFELVTMPAGNVTIKAVWTLNTKCEYFLEPFKTVDGVEIPAKNLIAGDEIDVRVSIRTNYPVGQGIFGIMFDKRVFSLYSTTTSKLAVANPDSVYLNSINTTKTISGTANFASTNWAGFFADDASFEVANWQCSRLQTATFKSTNIPQIIAQKDLVFTYKLKVNANISSDITSGAIRLDERMCRTPVNATTKYPTCVAMQKLNTSTNAYTVSDTVNLVPDVTNAYLDIPILSPNSELAARTGSTTVVDYTEGYVYGLEKELTLAKFASDYAQVIGTGTIECADTDLHTGSVIKVMCNDVCRAQYTVVIFGDVDGNGTVDGTDAYYVNLVAAGMIPADALSDAQKLAADPNHDGVIDTADGALLADSGLLKAAVSQVLPA